MGSINWQTDVINAGLTGTDAEIHTALSSDPRTLRPIQLDELLHMLNLRGMLTRLIRPADSGEKWSGSIVEMLNWLEGAGASNAQLAQLSVGAQQWFSHITNDRSKTFDTTDLVFAEMFFAIVTVTGGQPGLPTLEDYQAMYSLSGGLRYAGLTEANVVSARESWEHEQTVQTLDDRFKTARTDAGLVIARGGTLEEALTAAVASLSGEG